MTKFTQETYLEFVKSKLESIRILIKRKNTDYTAGGGPFANFEMAEDYGVDPLVGLCVRMGDKVKRIQSFCKSGNLLGESVDDSFEDLIGYSLIALAMLEERKANHLPANYPPDPVLPEDTHPRNQPQFGTVLYTDELTETLKFTGVLGEAKL